MLINGERRLIKKGEVVSCEDDSSQNIFFVKSGTLCQTIVNQKLNKPYFVLSLTLPDGLTGKTLLLRKNAHPVRIFAVKKTELFVLKRHTAENLINSNDKLQNYFDTFKAVADQVEINGLIASSTLNAEERLKLFYRSLLVRYASDMNADFVKLPVKFSRPEISMVIYSTLQTINRHLAQWASSGFLKVSCGSYFISPKLFVS